MGEFFPQQTEEEMVAELRRQAEVSADTPLGQSIVPTGSGTLPLGMMTPAAPGMSVAPPPAVEPPEVDPAEAGAAAAVDPMAGLTPQQLAAPMVVSRTGTGGTSRTMPVGYAPGVLEGLSEAGKAKLRSVDAEVAASTAAARAVESVIAANIHTQDAARAAAIKEQTQIREAAAKYQAEVLEPLRKNVEAMHVDPSRYFKRKGVFGNIANALAAGMAGFVAGYRGYPGNFILDLIDREVDRDVKVQENEIARARGNLTEARSIYKDFRVQGLDARTAALETQNFVRSKMTDQLAQQAAASSVPTLQAAAERMRAESRERTALQSQQLFVQQAGRTTRTSGGSSTTMPLVKYLMQQKLAETQLKAAEASVLTQKAAVKKQEFLLKQAQAATERKPTPAAPPDYSPESKRKIVQFGELQRGLVLMDKQAGQVGWIDRQMRGTKSRQMDNVRRQVATDWKKNMGTDWKWASEDPTDRNLMKEDIRAMAHQIREKIQTEVDMARALGQRNYALEAMLTKYDQLARARGAPEPK